MNFSPILGDSSLEFRCTVTLEDGRITLLDSDFSVSRADPCSWVGTRNGLSFRLWLDGEQAIRLELQNESGLCCKSLGWSLTYRDSARYLSDGRVPCFGNDVSHSGLVRLRDVRHTEPDSCMTGIMFRSTEPCLLLATKLPQKNLHLYQTFLLDRHTVRFQAVTSFPQGQQRSARLCTEATYILAGLTPLRALQLYSQRNAPQGNTAISPPLTGWNSWDYYFRTVRAENVLENADAILQDPILREKLRCIIIDDGWAHCEGEWYPNYRFPEGMRKLAADLQARGFTPGIWTNGCQVHPLSCPAMRESAILIRKPDGMPLCVDGLYVIDPTHPAGEAYILALYRRLYEYGFRVFKVDFVSALLHAERFYKPDTGPYDAIRRLFVLIRQAVGPESHIIGCSYPVECGAGYVDSCRIGVDIHNQWSHVCWCLEYLQLKFWCGKQFFRIDPDFLLVRGQDTSLESETNVFNPSEALPYDPENRGDRWRRGPVFDFLEAETWANIVVFAGGNLLLSDRLSMLNPAGRDLLLSHLTPLSVPAEPLDLGDAALSSIWYSGDKLLLINHGETMTLVRCAFSEYSLQPPKSVYSEKPFSYTDGCVTAMLQRHESIVLTLEMA